MEGFGEGKGSRLPFWTRPADFFGGSLGRVFSFFCSTSFWDGFFIDFGCIFEANIRPKIKILGGFWNSFLAISF